MELEKIIEASELLGWTVSNEKDGDITVTRVSKKMKNGTEFDFCIIGDTLHKMETNLFWIWNDFPVDDMFCMKYRGDKGLCATKLMDDVNEVHDELEELDKEWLRIYEDSREYDASCLAEEIVYDKFFSMFMDEREAELLKSAILDDVTEDIIETSGEEPTPIDAEIAMRRVLEKRLGCYE